MKRKGVILAGGSGTRLAPLTDVTSKQLLPIYDKPMIYYPLTTLMLAGIQEFIVISTPDDLPRFRALLGSGEDWGVDFQYATQNEPNGIAEALVIADDFLSGHRSALILGDNFFYGHGLGEILQKVANRDGATLFAYQVRDPERYGVVVVDGEERPVELLEKPSPAPSNWAVTGLYFYDEDAPAIAKGLRPSDRGELEITDVNREYLRQSRLRTELLYRGFAWLDTGTHDSLHEASSFVQTVQARQGLLIASPEEVAYRMGFINGAKLQELASRGDGSEYAKYLDRVAQVSPNAGR